MNPLKKAKGAYLRWRAYRAKSALLSQAPDASSSADDFAASLRDPSAYYVRAFQDFHRTCPAELRAHRDYFRQDSRGFGEDAFHSMWWRLVRKFRPASFLEIGVYRGQVLSLVSLIARLEKIECAVTGISPFSSAGDSVSVYLSNLDYQADTLANFRHFNLPEPVLLKAYSTDQAALDVIASKPWDMIYIDGNHDYDVVLKDWQACSAALTAGGIIVLDDSGLSSRYRPLPFSTAGHPGPSKLASEIDSSQFEEILQVGHNRVFRKR
jgi:hypothetical protein